jgi:outer membrane protein assembly factor BamB
VWPPLNEFWATELESEVAGHVIAAKGLIFAALRNGTAVALDASSGAMVWKRSLGARVETSPALSGDSLLVATVDAQLIGISLAGDQRFALRLPSPARAALTATEHTVFIGDRSGAFVTVDLGTLQPALRHQFGDEITAAVSLAHGLAFVASWEASVAAFDTTTWQTRWIWRGDSPIASALAVAEDVAIWTCDQGEVVCANPLTGELIWQVKLPAGSRAAPAVSPDHVLVASLDGAIRALRRSDGKQLWEFPTADQVLCAPLVTGEIVYISSRDGSLYALSLADGEQRWRYATSYGVYATVAVVEGALVVPLRQRHVVAFVPGEEAV